MTRTQAYNLLTGIVTMGLATCKANHPQYAADFDRLAKCVTKTRHVDSIEFNAVCKANGWT